MDKLDRIFQMQKALDDDITRRRGLEDIGFEEWIQKDVLAITAELSELLNEVNFKWWKNKKPIDDALLKGELVDVLQFFCEHVPQKRDDGGRTVLALQSEKSGKL